MESAVDRAQNVRSLVTKAEKYRNLARMVTDWRTAENILALVKELKQRARALATPNEKYIRKRAWEIWKENSEPTGRDEEFWFQAEREFREAERVLKENGLA
jgi:hypothetical protein